MAPHPRPRGEHDTAPDPGMRAPVVGRPVGLLLITPEADRSGYDVQRSIRHLTNVITVDVVAADGTAQVRVRVADEQSLQRIAARFRQQVGVAHVTATILSPDAVDAILADHPEL